MNNADLPPLYTSSRLVMLVKRWVNLKKIKRKSFLEKDSVFKLAYKDLLAELSIQPSPFQFNNRSIEAILSEIFK